MMKEFLDWLSSVAICSAMFFAGVLIGLSNAETIKRQAIQYGYAHYVGEDQKWEWIKPEGVE